MHRNRAARTRYAGRQTGPDRGRSGKNDRTRSGPAALPDRAQRLQDRPRQSRDASLPPSAADRMSGRGHQSAPPAATARQAPPAPPLHRQHRTTAQVRAMQAPARSKPHPAARPPSRRRAARPGRCRATGPAPRPVAARSSNRACRRSAGSGSPLHPKVSARHTCRPTADASAPPDWRAAAKGTPHRPRGPDAMPPRMRPGRCPKRTGPPDPQALAPDPAGRRFPPSRAFRGK